jgi:hypothetical protein
MEHEHAHDRDINIWDWIVIVLAIFSIGLFLFEFSGDRSPQAIALLRSLDIGIAFIFLGDFFGRFLLIKDRKKFLRRYWWQLLAGIPVSAFGTQALRGIMVLRLLRVFRLTSLGVRLEILYKAVRHFTHETYLVSMFLGLVFYILAASLAFFWIESPVHPEIQTVGQSIWWIINAVTTTGTNINPMTVGGKILGGLSMIGGFAMFGVFTALLASYFLSKKKSVFHE